MINIECNIKCSCVESAKYLLDIIKQSKYILENNNNILIIKDSDEVNKDIKAKQDKVIKANYFELFWKIYPKKVGKEKCFRWYISHNINSDLNDIIIKSIEKQKTSNQWRDSQYIPQPYTWLNRSGWNDELTYDNVNVNINTTTDNNNNIEEEMSDEELQDMIKDLKI